MLGAQHVSNPGSVIFLKILVCFYDCCVTHCQALAAIEAGDGSEVVAVAGAGHWLYLQQPGECFNHVKRFLGKQ